ncbi:MAG: lytic transglycosylase domain-containing protein [Algoriphagus sp.]|uniref:lytic transglycosylase domain-containing protein n=1 Tax=Algoriphagus sp. TaxID=1872435 RepID=UPI00273198E2|nr:lytic transglycosylase domain-containing protein [Algoriphagus sp.]MDP2040061.1 lytic transglycosylase domain-containing protein [Algoriphagus sp.]MDP3472966.1 lytic transglycosylase domain-containing protein [Algoriphagus sp.]
MSRNHLFLIYFLLFFSIALGTWAVLKTPQSQGDNQNLMEERSYPVQAFTITRDSIRLFDIPKNLDFAGEKVPLEKGDIFERLEREIYVNAYWESNMILLLKRSAKYLPEIERMLKENGIPDDFKYVAIAESALMNVGSPAGARGFWQILESTGKEYGLEISNDVDERYHFEKSTLAAAKYFKKAHAKFGDWTAVAASYNMGQSGFSKRQEEQLHSNYYELYLNEETSRYLFRILAFKIIFENPGAFGYHFRESDYYQTPVLRTIRVDEDIKDLPKWAKDQGSSYKDLKLYNPWLRDRNLNVRKGKVYEIMLPK